MKQRKIRKNEIKIDQKWPSIQFVGDKQNSLLMVSFGIESIDCECVQQTNKGKKRNHFHRVYRKSQKYHYTIHNLCIHIQVIKLIFPIVCLIRI